MSDSVHQRIILELPIVQGNRVDFKWTESVNSKFYKKTEFYVEFPECIDLKDVPQSMLLLFHILCLHAHWTILSPCTVEIPIKLPLKQLEIINKLIQYYSVTLNFLNPENIKGEVEIKELGEEIEKVIPLNRSTKCAAAFSGGKDSLTSVGLLCEMGFSPILITTTSFLNGIHLENSIHKKRSLSEIQKRKELKLYEVKTNYRSIWNNLISRKMGYQLSINEITDTFLYVGSMLIIGYAKNVDNLFIASENEVSANIISEQGEYIQHPHFMYSALTLSGMSTLFSLYGMRLFSLTTSLRSNMVQELLTKRYSELADLQCSCWKVTEQTKACSVCGECKRLSLVSLSVGGNPKDLGVNLIEMFNNYEVPNISSIEEHDHISPKTIANISFQNQYNLAYNRLNMIRLCSYLILNQPKEFFTYSGWRAINKFRILKALHNELTINYSSSYMANYLEFIEEPFKSKLQFILSDAFDVESESIYDQQFKNLKLNIEKLNS